MRTNPRGTKGQLPKGQRWLYDPVLKRLPDNQGGDGGHKDPYRAMQAGGAIVAVAGLLVWASCAAYKRLTRDKR